MKISKDMIWIMPLWSRIWSPNHLANGTLLWRGLKWELTLQTACLSWVVEHRSIWHTLYSNHWSTAAFSSTQSPVIMLLMFIYLTGLDMLGRISAIKHIKHVARQKLWSPGFNINLAIKPCFHLNLVLMISNFRDLISRLYLHTVSGYTPAYNYWSGSILLPLI